MPPTPKKLRVVLIPLKHRPYPSHAVGVAVIPIDTPDDAVIEWCALDPETARTFARMLDAHALESETELHSGD